MAQVREQPRGKKPPANRKFNEKLIARLKTKQDSHD